MECNLKNRQELMNRYVTGGLSEGDAKAFEEHYFQCEICFQELRALEDAINVIENEGKNALHIRESPEDNENGNLIKKTANEPKHLKISWGIAASFAVVILAILFIRLPTNDEDIVDKNTNTAAAKDSSAIKNTPGTLKNPDNKPIEVNRPPRQQVEEYAENLSGPEFKPNAYLEAWSTENVRSGNEIFDKVISPGNGQKFHNEEIKFKWLMLENEPVTIKILTNKEKEIYRYSPDQSTFPNLAVAVSSEVFKNSGLYYWRIEDSNDVLYIGKFYFIKN